MKSLGKEERNENLLYLVIWVVIFIICALLALAQGYGQPERTGMKGILDVWGRTLPFLILFLIHNYILAPLLIRRRNVYAYAIGVIVLLAVFSAFIIYTKIGPDPSMRPPEPPKGSLPPGDIPRGPLQFNPEVLRILIGILLIAANLGIKFQFQSSRNAARVQELEKENLQHRLDALRYQINPHFFMNTLNNIHALVDLDPEKAKESIVELSRMMRHILYDSGSPTIPLSQELEFLRHYISLMKIRYTEGVTITLDLPESDEGTQVPPLVFSSFIENAFKHGISYESESYVKVSLVLDNGKTIFRCSNSRLSPRSKDKDSGIGQENVRRRLDLLYGENYTLHIDQPEGSYDILLILPYKPENSSLS